MAKVIRLNTKNGPKALGPYSTATVYQGVMYISGQLGINPTTGELVGSDVESQGKRAMENLKLFMDEVKISMGDMIKCTVYLKVLIDLHRICLTSQNSMLYTGNIFQKGSTHQEWQLQWQNCQKGRSWRSKPLQQLVLRKWDICDP